MKPRKYTLKQRAEQQRQTRERIVDAAMALHEELGPAETTISAIADRAGVQRLTVYRHFPTDEDLFGACSSKWFGLHPPPDLAKLTAASPPQRTHAALLALYRYYRSTEGMWVAVHRDVEKLPAVAGALAKFESYLAALSGDLLKSWAPRKSKQLRATLAHAVRFSTWRSLAAQPLSDAAAADLVRVWVVAAAGR